MNSACGEVWPSAKRSDGAKRRGRCRSQRQGVKSGDSTRRRTAEQAAAIALANGCQAALLKAKSPSCGSGVIYDGSFTGRLIPGWGVAAERLQALGIPVLDETQWRQLLDK